MFNFPNIRRRLNTQARCAAEMDCSTACAAG
jgi:hypothetical protein